MHGRHFFLLPNSYQQQSNGRPLLNDGRSGLPMMGLTTSEWLSLLSA